MYANEDISDLIAFLNERAAADTDPRRAESVWLAIAHYERALENAPEHSFERQDDLLVGYRSATREALKIASRVYGDEPGRPMHWEPWKP